MNLIRAQRRVAEENFQTSIFLEGVTGTGKTTAAIERVKNLIREGVPPESILILVPQPALALPYREGLRRARTLKGASVQTTTFSALAAQTVDLFWPLIAEDVGFADPLDRPHFLSLELVQYYMTHFIAPEIRDKDYFNSVPINPNRLHTQIVDNLNKAALVGFPHEDIGRKLKDAWTGDAKQAHIYDDAQACANLFRELCRQHNLIDFSFQMEIFKNYLWQMEQPKRYLFDQYRHLIIDNVEEDTPLAHDILKDWLYKCDSAVVIYDTEGGYRRFLGADPLDAYSLKTDCIVHIELDKARVMTPELEAFQVEFARSLKRPDAGVAKADAREAIAYSDSTKYLPQMIDWTADNISSLIHNDGASPGDIVILSAFLPDAMRFALQTRLNERDIPNRSHRPSRALREEPAARTLITLSKLAHPAWAIVPDKFDVAYALTASIAELDLVRARLLTDILFRNGQLLPFEQIKDVKIQSRITFELAARYERLRLWLEKISQADALPLDMFFSRLFGEMLSQPGFDFHQDYDAARTTANLVDSARNFRQTVGKIEPDLELASEYVRMVDSGAIANQYMREPGKRDQDAVLIAPAFTFLMNNVPVNYQFWLNVGASGWGQRLDQPLTHAYVLSRQWEEGDKWEDPEEFQANQETIYLLASGLIRRCRKKIFLGFSEYGEQGVEQRGSLLLAVQSMLRRLAKEERDV
ncbi:MAG: UvrD-helicase domain-containing protein [Chloroflexota bacterium]